MVLVLGDQVLVQPYLMRLTTDAPVINVAGRQRMLSQRLVKAALVVNHEGGERREAAIEEMKQVLGVWSASHDWLLVEDARTRWIGRNSVAVREGLAGLAPSFLAMRDAAQHLIEAEVVEPEERPRSLETQPSLSVLLDHEADYLRKMDRIVGLYEREARGRIETFRWVGWGLAVLSLAALAAIGRLIFRPTLGLVRRQVVELGQARDELDARVRERTGELQAAQERHRVLLEQYSHVGRTQAVGEMASALAHELNQPLGAIANYAEGCLILLDTPEPALGDIREALQKLRSTTMRAARIIEQVRRFVSRQEPSHERFEANQVVKDVMAILEAEAHRRGIPIQLELASGLPLLWGDPVQIQQVLVNLVKNALESLAQTQTQHPTLVITTRLVDRDRVEVSVSDNGEGIPPDQLARIFDAYFSTRAGGMGMGLAICRTIVEAHQGRFQVESEPGIRTGFRFQLPAAHI